MSITEKKQQQTIEQETDQEELKKALGEWLLRLFQEAELIVENTRTRKR